MIISYSAIGPNMSNGGAFDGTSLFGENTTFSTFDLAGVGASNASLEFLNQTNHGSLYNFSISIAMSSMLNWLPDSVHTYEIVGLITNLGKPVSVTQKISFFEVSN